jgi:streptomycin 6-kinase
MNRIYRGQPLVVDASGFAGHAIIFTARLGLPRPEAEGETGPVSGWAADQTVDLHGACSMSEFFGHYLERWRLIPDGAPILTRSSRLLPVLRGDAPAMIKIAISPEERAGASLLRWWSGRGAAIVLEHDADAVLLERATGNRSLVQMATAGGDDEASELLCRVISELHAPRPEEPPRLVPLVDWFRPLLAAPQPGISQRCARAARGLLDDPRDLVPLHGDMHHGNVLDFGQRGWLAIDPKGLLGERAFDYANLFVNPDYTTASAPGCLARRVALVTEAARLDPARLLRWILAWAGLSALWRAEDGETEHARATLRIAERVAAEIDMP